MTTYVSESSPSVLAGIGKMKSAMVTDFIVGTFFMATVFAVGWFCLVVF